MLASLGIIISTVLTLTYAAVLKVLRQLDTLLQLFVDVHLAEESGPQRKSVNDIRTKFTVSNHPGKHISSKSVSPATSNHLPVQVPAVPDPSIHLDPLSKRFGN